MYLSNQLRHIIVVIDTSISQWNSVYADILHEGRALSQDLKLRCKWTYSNTNVRLLHSSELLLNLSFKGCIFRRETDRYLKCYLV